MPEEIEIDKIMRWFDRWSEIIGWTIIIISVVWIIIPALWKVFVK